MTRLLSREVSRSIRLTETGRYLAQVIFDVGYKQMLWLDFDDQQEAETWIEEVVASMNLLHGLKP